MPSVAGVFELGLIAVAIVSWLGALVSYLRMMRTIAPEITRLHVARLRIRGSLLFLAAPQLFVGAGATWRRRYIVALLVFMASVALGFVASAFALAEAQTRSTTSAMPWPTPMHIVHSA